MVALSYFLSKKTQKQKQKVIETGEYEDCFGSIDIFGKLGHFLFHSDKKKKSFYILFAECSVHHYNESRDQLIFHNPDALPSYKFWDDDVREME